jgi:hypothetical protein
MHMALAHPWSGVHAICKTPWQSTTLWRSFEHVLLQGGPLSKSNPPTPPELLFATVELTDVGPAPPPEGGGRYALVQAPKDAAAVRAKHARPRARLRLRGAMPMMASRYG